MTENKSHELVGSLEAPTSCLSKPPARGKKNAFPFMPGTQIRSLCHHHALLPFTIFTTPHSNHAPHPHSVTSIQTSPSASAKAAVAKASRPILTTQSDCIIIISHDRDRRVFLFHVVPTPHGPRTHHQSPHARRDGSQALSSGTRTRHRSRRCCRRRSQHEHAHPSRPRRKRRHHEEDSDNNTARRRATGAKQYRRGRERAGA